MQNSRWMLNKTGMVDFWYYDLQEFDFEDGRMLLRGSNGCGKSVTMESFIPFLLDGNKSPERLDSFCTKSKKLEDYILEEDDERQERTSYLYMEFKRRQTEEYISFGIGMKASRDTQMQMWYFCINDKRRIGKDINLYKVQAGEKIPYSKTELKNKIGDGGIFVEKQSEYMAIVNKYIFGFETLDEYKKLLDLIIKLRSPKLSKEFKPTIINSILSDSLQTLSDEDLMTMSGAIENMDNTKEMIKKIKESIESANKINKVYMKYNEKILYEKALKFNEDFENLKNIEKDIKNEEKFKTEQEEFIKKAKEKLQNYKEETEALDYELERFRTSDITILHSEKEKISKNIESLKDKIEKDKGEEEKYLDRQMHTRYKIKHINQDMEQKSAEIKKSLEKMDFYNSDTSFKSHAFFKDEITEDLKQKEPKYDFSLHEKNIKTYTEDVKIAVEDLKEQKNIRDNLDDAKRVLEESMQEQKKNENERERLENQFHEIKQELIEKVCKWEENNLYLKLSNNDLKLTIRRINNFELNFEYFKIKEISENRYKEIYLDMDLYLNLLKEDERAKKDDCSKLETEVETLKNTKLIEPEKDESVIKNRKKLREMGIPYIEFYKAVDFKDKISGKKADLLEESLLKMGILDSLIIDKKYRDKVLKADEGNCDRYIFSEGDKVQTNIMQNLSVSKQCTSSFKDTIRLILETIGKSNNSDTWIDEDGNYKTGIIFGNITKTYQAKYIGIEAREKNRLKKIKELEEEIKNKKDEILKIQENIEKAKNKKDILKTEFENFPKSDDLFTAIECIKNIDINIRADIEKVEQNRKKFNDLSKIQLMKDEKANRSCKKIDMVQRLDTVCQCLENMEQYKNENSNLKQYYTDYRHKKETLKIFTENLNEIDFSIKNIKVRIRDNETDMKIKKRQLESVKNELMLKGEEEVRKRIEYCKNRREYVSKEILRYTSENSASKEKLKSCEEKIKNLLNRKNEAENKKNFSKKLLKEEIRLKFSYTDIKTEKEIEKAAIEIEEKKESDNSIYNFASNIKSSLFERCSKLSTMEYENSLHTVLNKYKAALVDYTVSMDMTDDDKENKRYSISANYNAKKISFKDLIENLCEEEKSLDIILNDKDKELFEDILANTICKKIRARINASKRWVKKMNELMDTMNTSSGLKLSLNWKNKTAETEMQLDTKELVNLLQQDTEIMKKDDYEKITGHFRSKIDEARKRERETGNDQSFYSLVKDVLDYRKWFEFQIQFQKNNERKKELTNNMFFKFSGGEKAMCMYVPLFSAVVAKYSSARKDAPRLVCLDEAFAGIDQRNIKDMFRLMVEFDFNFIVNSQILWGDYETVPSLAIYNLIRTDNEKFISVLSYKWNGREKISSVDYGDYTDKI